MSIVAAIPEKRFLTRSEAALWLGVSIDTLTVLGSPIAARLSRIIRRPLIKHVMRQGLKTFVFMICDTPCHDFVTLENFGESQIDAKSLEIMVPPARF
jgi:hypothetical protein